MQTVRDLIEYVINESLQYLEKSGNLKDRNSFLEEKLRRKFLGHKEISLYKNKSIVPQKKTSMQSPVKVNLNLQELQLSQIICEVHGVDFNNLYSRSRKMDLVDARRQLTSFLYVYMSYTYSHVGRLFGKDHSTIIHNLRSHEDLLETNILYMSRFVKFLEIARIELPELFDIIEQKSKSLREYERVRNERAVNTYKRLLINK